MTEQNKIDQVTVSKFMINYLVGDYPFQRLGQAFLNTHFPNVVDPDLFYETDDNISWITMLDKYVDFSA